MHITVVWHFRKFRGVTQKAWFPARCATQEFGLGRPAISGGRPATSSQVKVKSSQVTSQVTSQVKSQVKSSQVKSLFRQTPNRPSGRPIQASPLFFEFGTTQDFGSKRADTHCS